MNIDDDRSACSDSWTMLFITNSADTDISGDETSSNAPIGEFITHGIKANTLLVFLIILIHKYNLDMQYMFKQD